MGSKNKQVHHFKNKCIKENASLSLSHIFYREHIVGTNIIKILVILSMKFPSS